MNGAGNWHIFPDLSITLPARTDTKPMLDEAVLQEEKLAAHPAHHRDQ